MTASRSLLRVPVESFLPLRFVGPFAIFSIVLGTTISLDHANLWAGLTWAGIHTITVLGAGLIAVTAHAVLRVRRVSSVSVWFIATVGVAVGLIKAILTASLEAALGVTVEWTDNLATRALGATVAAVWVLVLSAYADTGFQRLRHARDELVRLNVATRLRTGHSVHQFELNKPLSRLESLRTAMTSDRQTPSSFEIRKIVDQTIRPVSTALWSVENARYPKIAIRSFLEASLQSKKMRAGWIAGLWAITSFAGLAIPAGVPESAVINLTIGLLAYSVWRISPRFLPGAFFASLAAIVAISAATVVGGFFIAAGVFASFELSLSTAELLTGITWMILTVMGGSVLSGAFAISETIEHDLSNVRTQTLIQEHSDSVLAEETGRNFATYLHGDIQSRLLGIATAIDHNRLSPEAVSTELDGVIESLRRLNEDSPAETVPAGVESIEERLTVLLDSWRGLMTVTIDSESAKRLVRALEQNPGLLEIVREGMTNAHKHGLARAVSIACEEDGVLTITDDGYGPRHGTPGLGSALLNRWCGNDWELTDGGDGGAKLRVALHSDSPARFSS